MPSRYFDDLDALTRHQCKRELDEALRVRSMTPLEFSHWLTAALSSLQDLAGLGLASEMTSSQPAARCFATLEDKNHHDQQRELARAIRLARQRKTPAASA